MLELGCGSGANLALAMAYEWRVTGVDLVAQALADARFNLGQTARLIEADLARGLPPEISGGFDAVMIPNLLCYLTRTQARVLLRALRDCVQPGAEVFVRTRTPDDHRCGRGDEIEPLTWRLRTQETGESGLINCFYEPAELADLLQETLGLSAPTIMAARFDNPQCGVMVGNADVIIWGEAS